MTENHYMVDIETTGVDKERDRILEVAAIELRYDAGFWHPTGRAFHELLHYSGQPESEFAKKHMTELYKKCGEQEKHKNTTYVSKLLKSFIHDGKDNTPKFFMGWNASTFDIPFLIAKEMLTPSYYETVNGRDKLLGDVHYRIYEQTGALNYVVDMTGLSRKDTRALAESLNPTGIVLPEGKAHDALYDCYWQTILMNGLISIGRNNY